MKVIKAYQNKEAEQWRLMTAEARATKLTLVCDKLASLTVDKDKSLQAFAHILNQASNLDKSTLLIGATGESNELYYQARGLTIVMGAENAQKLPVLIQLMSALLTGNQVLLNFVTQAKFVVEVLGIFQEMDINELVLDAECAENAEENQNKNEMGEMLAKHTLLAQVAIVGTMAEVQNLSTILSHTEGMLTQVIAITDQTNLTEIFNPEYLHRFCTERVRTINTTAIGGNASLIELGVE